MTLDTLIGDQSQFSLEHRILNTVLLFGMFLAATSVIFTHCIINMGIVAMSCIIIAVILLIIYYVSRIKKQYSIAVFLLIDIFTLICFPVMWVITGGVLGGIAFFLLLFSSMIVILHRGARRIITIGCLVGVTSALIIFEYYYPAYIIDYRTTNDRYLGITFSLLITMLVNASLYAVILNQYVKEHTKARSYLAQIEKQKLAMEFQNDLKLVNVKLQQEITERKHVEHSLRMSDARFAKAFRASPIPMCIITSKDRYFIDVNDSFVNVFEFQHQEFIGKTPKELNICAEVDDCLISVVAENRAIYNMDIRFLTKFGVERTVLLSVELMELDGVQCLLGVLNDITDRIHLEKEMARLDRLNLVGEMAASIGHEVRNPLTTVRGFLQFFQGKAMYHQHVENFDLMIEELDRANAIITEFLSLAKNRVINRQPHYLDQIIEELYPLIQASALREGKEVLLELNGLPRILADESEIKQCILNFTQNALEAVDAGGKITIAAYVDDKTAVLSVKDTGKGIPPEIYEKLGTPFLTTKDKGTGLGLAVCYRIAERHKAKIEVVSSSTGTNFAIKIPLL